VTDTRLTLRQAAAALGVSESAIRKRVERGTLRSDKGADGRRYVYVDTVTENVADEGEDRSVTREHDALISELRAHNDTLREQLEAERQGHAEARRLLLEALAKIPPAIEAPPDERESPETAREKVERAEQQPRPTTVESQESVQRPWWRRVCSEDEREGSWDVEAHANANLWAPSPIRGGAWSGSQHRREPWRKRMR
jgi:hypothetical protein